MAGRLRKQVAPSATICLGVWPEDSRTPQGPDGYPHAARRKIHDGDLTATAIPRPEQATRWSVGSTPPADRLFRQEFREPDLNRGNSHREMAEGQLFSSRH